MKPLIWKEFREHLKWIVVPGVLILLPSVLLGGPSEPMPSAGGAFLFFLIASASAAALGFVQVFFESRGDSRALLLHRPLGRSRIFAGKAIAGVGLYLLALGVPFLCIQVWIAIPGHMPAPYAVGTSLPWVAEILAGVVYYFAGMLTAQREARWYGSRGLGLFAALFCTFLVWTLPEFWQALVAIGIFGAMLGVAAWGSFVSGGAYEPQPRLAKAALGLTLLTGLLVVSVLAKYLVGACFDPGISTSYHLDRHGRVLIVPWKTGLGPVGAVTGLDGKAPPDLAGKRVDRNLIEEIGAPMAGMDWPVFQSYRNPGRFYVVHFNESTPGTEVWYYVPDQGRLLGYDEDFKQFLGSFGPDGFVPAGREPTARFQGTLSYPSRLWEVMSPNFLAFPGGVYAVDFSRRTIRTLFTPPSGETVVWARWWKDRREKESLAIVSTDQSVHILTPTGTPVLSVRRAFDRKEYGALSVGRLENPERYVIWYSPSRWLEPEERDSMPSYLLEYDVAGHELARRSLPRIAEAERSPALALFGLATPMTEVTTLVGVTRYLRGHARETHGAQTSVLVEMLEMWIGNFIPMAVYRGDTSSGVFFGFTTSMLLSATLCGLGCFLLGRRYAFTRSRRLFWLVCGFLYGPVGLLLMLALQDFPARIACPSCRKPRIVTRATCEHCGAAHATPARDGTEIFDEAAPSRDAVLVGR